MAYWQDDDYRGVFAEAGLEVSETRQPLATGDELYEWVSETKKPHWTV